MNQFSSLCFGFCSGVDQFQVRIVFATGDTMGLAEGIIDDTCLVGHVDAQDCHQNGKAIGTFINVKPAKEYNECLRHCQADMKCQCFSHNQDDKTCLEFSSCDQIDLSCSSCFSGRSDCNENLECNIQGICNGQLINVVTKASEFQCLSHCQSNEDCEFYAYHRDTKFCTLLNNCSSVTDCNTCLSGGRSCTLTPPGCDCGPNSMCENNDGKFACKCNPGYEMMEKVCKKCPPSSLCARIAFKGKDFCSAGLHNCNVNADCTSTIGSFSCRCKPGYEGNGHLCKRRTNEDHLTTLMVVGGFPTPVKYDAELIDLSGKRKKCRKPQDYPGAQYGSVATFINHKAIVCGGCCPHTAKCWIYVPSDRTWLETAGLTTRRDVSSSTYVQGQWWITGGYNPDDTAISTTEIWSSDDNNFIYYENLPEGRYYHSIVGIDKDKAILIGGQKNYTKTFMYDGGSWVEGPSLAIGRRRGQAGFITFSNGTRVVVAAGGVGERSTELLNLDEQEQKWILGPDLPHEISNGFSVQMGDTFLIVGGRISSGNTTYYDSILMFNTSIENWIFLDEKLEKARAYTTAFLVPDRFC